uniref:Uncharacterized protein n=1 Tax=Aegilops tauschii TaxID=37682 RepID=N1QVH3_AEGTA
MTAAATMLQLLELGGNRFGFATTRVITSDGAEIDDMRLVRDGDHLLLVSDHSLNLKVGVGLCANWINEISSAS